MSQPFGMSYGPKDFQTPKCERCEKEVKANEKLVMDRKTIHKSCFKCGICDKALQHGSSGLDERLKLYGPIWLCKEHLVMAPKAKEEAIVKKGYKPRGAPAAAKKK